MGENRGIEFLHICNTYSVNVRARKVVRCLWDYIKTHDLKNPADKREVFLDAELESVFGIKT